MTNNSVRLRGGKSASTIFYEVLSSAIKEFDLDAGELNWPSSVSRFKKDYVNLIPRFEVMRLAHRERTAIANHMATEILTYLVVEDEQRLEDKLLHAADELPLSSVNGQGSLDWQPRFFYEGRDWHDFAALGGQLLKDNVINQGAAESLAFASQELIGPEGVSLKGRKIVVLGAAAEIASTREFLASGADILWLDKAPPPEELLAGQGYSGTLSFAEDNADLLTQPVEILNTIKQFASESPIDLCLYAYAPGQARELRLTGTMCAMVNALPSESIASVTMLVSPTTASALDQEDIDVMEARLEDRPGWESILDSLGLLGNAAGVEREGSFATIKSLVSIQGASYQAAQYLCKLIMAEAWASHGHLFQPDFIPLRVSANTAAITQTKSLDHPVFDAAFGGAAALQVQTFTPEQSQCLNAVLTIVDWLKKERPVPGAVRIHGGIHTLPYPLEAALKPAAAIGFAKSPGLLMGLVRGGK